MSPLDVVLAGLAGCAAGGINALAGGGTLVSFPVLVALGVPPVSANVTNTVALSPGYLGGALSQRAQIEEQRHRVRRLALVAAVGGLSGSILLLLTSDAVFSSLLPFLLLVATLMLAAQERLRGWLRLDAPDPQPGPPLDDGTLRTRSDPAYLAVPVFAASVYGGFFGAGLGIMFLAVLGTVLHDPLPRLNALKQVLAFAVNVTAALFFVFSGRVYWGVGLALAVGAIVGGHSGGRIAGSVRPEYLRRIVVATGFVVALVYAAKEWL
jgi:uncharacterized protein